MYLVLALCRFTVSLSGVQEHHRPCQPAHIAKDTIFDKLQLSFPNIWSVLAKPWVLGTHWGCASLVQDLLTMNSCFKPLRVEGHTLRAVLSDLEGDHWLVLVVHFPNEPFRQKKVWKCLI